MRKTAATVAVLLACSRLFAASHVGFGLDAFNRAVGAGVKCGAAFSPASFEIDCVLMSEAFGALTRAHFAETMGVLNGLEAVYGPISARYDEASRTNRFALLHARAYCLPDERKAHPVYRQWMQRTFAAESFSGDFCKGAEMWVRARMDGEMEGFTLPKDVVGLKGYSFFDVLSFRCSWAEPFPTGNTRELPFQLDDGTSKSVRMMCDVRPADVWVRRNHTLLRLPLADESWFYAMMPREGLTVGDIRTELTSKTIPDVLSGMNSVVEPGISHGATVVAIPVMDITFESNLAQPLSYFKFPVAGMERLEEGLQPKHLKQVIRFRLDESGLDPEPLATKPADRAESNAAETRKLVLNRPFIFFIYHEPTATMAIAGQFTGR